MIWYLWRLRIILNKRRLRGDFKMKNRNRDNNSCNLWRSKSKTFSVANRKRNKLRVEQEWKISQPCWRSPEVSLQPRRRNLPMGRRDVFWAGKSRSKPTLSQWLQSRRKTTKMHLQSQPSPSPMRLNPQNPPFSKDLAARKKWPSLSTKLWHASSSIPTSRALTPK